MIQKYELKKLRAHDVTERLKSAIREYLKFHTMIEPKPQRVRLSRRKGFNLQEASFELNRLPAVNCARPSIYGNPFIVGKHGDTAKCVDLFRKLCAGFLCISVDADCIAAQKRFIAKAVPKIKAGELRGKNLACFCQLSKPCHCDVLLDIRNGCQ